MTQPNTEDPRVLNDYVDVQSPVPEREENKTVTVDCASPQLNAFTSPISEKEDNPIYKDAIQRHQIPCFCERHRCFCNNITCRCVANQLANENGTAPIYPAYDRRFNQDLTTLASRRFLNSGIINTYFHNINDYMRNNSLCKNVFAFSTFFYEKLKERYIIDKCGFPALIQWVENKSVNLLQYHIILVPVYDMDRNHWALLGISTTDRTIYVFNSAVSAITEFGEKATVSTYTNIVKEFMKEYTHYMTQETGVVYDARQYPVAQQPARYDCGVYVILFASLLTFNPTPEATKELQYSTSRIKRDTIVHALLNHSIIHRMPMLQGVKRCDKPVQFRKLKKLSEIDAEEQNDQTANSVLSTVVGDVFTYKADDEEEEEEEDYEITYLTKHRTCVICKVQNGMKLYRVLCKCPYAWAHSGCWGIEQYHRGHLKQRCPRCSYQPVALEGNNEKYEQEKARIIKELNKSIPDKDMANDDDDEKMNDSMSATSVDAGNDNKKHKSFRKRVFGTTSKVTLAKFDDKYYNQNSKKIQKALQFTTMLKRPKDWKAASASPSSQSSTSD